MSVMSLHITKQLHYIAKNMWTRPSRSDQYSTFGFKTMGINMESVYNLNSGFSTRKTASQLFSVFSTILYKP